MQSNQPKPQRLIQIKTGQWYKTGTGRPVIATPDEVVLWQSAQEQALEKITKPSGIPDIAKYGTLAVTIITFLTLYVDWVAVNGRYSELGIPEFAFYMFTHNPMHVNGILLFGLITLLVISTINSAWDIFDSYIHPWIKKHPLIKNLSTLLSLLFPTGIFILLIYSFQDTKNLQNFSAVLTLGSIGIVLAFLILLKSDGEKGKPKQNVAMFTLFILVLTIFIGFFSVLPEAFGKMTSTEVLNGQTSMPGVFMIAKEKLLSMSSVSTSEGPDGQWAYWSEIVATQDNKAVFSLQYIGRSETDLYLLDYKTKLVYILPSDSIKVLSLYSSSEAIKAAPDLKALVPWKDQSLIKTK